MWGRRTEGEKRRRRERRRIGVEVEDRREGQEAMSEAEGQTQGEAKTLLLPVWFSCHHGLRGLTRLGLYTLAGWLAGCLAG